MAVQFLKACISHPSPTCSHPSQSTLYHILQHYKPWPPSAAATTPLPHQLASSPTSTPSSLASSTCGANCHQTQWGLHRSICSRTDSHPSCCVKPLYWTMFYQHLTMHWFYQFLLMSSIFTRILSLAHLFYAYFTHGPNKSASAQYDNTRGAWLTQEGGRKERGLRGGVSAPAG